MNVSAVPAEAGRGHLAVVGVKGRRELPDVGAGTQSSVSTAASLYCCTVFPAHRGTLC